MNAKDLPLDNCREGKIVKSIVEVIPNIMITIFFCDFVIETINESNVARFMIASKKYDDVRVFKFV